MATADKRELNGLNKLYLARQRADTCTTPSDPNFQKEYPNLFSLLGDNRVTEGLVVDPVRLSISNNGGDWLFSLYVPGLGLSGEVLAPTISAGFGELEKHLGGSQRFFKTSTKKAIKTRKLAKQENQ